MTPSRSQVLSRLVHVVRLHRWALFIGFTYFAFAVLMAIANRVDIAMPWLLWRSIVALAALITAVFVVDAIRILCVVRPDRPLHHLARDIVRFLSLERLAAGALVTALLTVHATSHGICKPLIPSVRPFWCDAHLAALDESLHGGHPWELLHGLIPPLATRYIDVCYIVWFYVVAAVAQWHAFSQPTSRHRMQFLLTYMLCFIVLGNIVATLLASMGPCYYQHAVGSGNPYASLIAYLSERDALAVEVQNLLWVGFTESDTRFGHGISAMPSIHVAIAFLGALSIWRRSRVVSVVLGLYAFIIMIGSVHLGWHYAVDGYVAIVGVWVIWNVVGWLLQRDPLLEDVQPCGNR